MPVLARPADPPVRSDLDSFQGVWMSVAGPREARFLVAGSRFTIEFIGGDLYMGTFKLAGHKNEPRHLDMHIEEGPADHAGRTALCIYQLEGGVLRWCPGRPGTNRRPTGFPDVDDPRFLSLVFQRVKRKNRR